MNRKLSPAQIEAMMEDYAKWDKYGKDSESIEELAKRHGVSKQTFYRHKKEWDRKRARQDEAALAPVLQLITGDLVAARAKVAELEALLAEREAEIRKLKRSR